MEYRKRSSGVVKSKLDYSRKTEVVYREVAPYEKDLKTGEILNPTNHPVLVENGKINVDEQIQSYAKDTDLYTLLARFNYNGVGSADAVAAMNSIVFNQNQGVYMDTTNLPKNIHEVTPQFEAAVEKAASMDTDARNALLADMSTEEIQAILKAKAIQQQETIKQQEVKEVVNNG